MKPQKGAEQQLRDEPQTLVLPSVDAAVRESSLSTEERAVVECLKEASAALTARQLQSRVAYDRDVLEAILQSLVERELVARLNTIIPSYSYRPSGSPLHEG